MSVHLAEHDNSSSSSSSRREMELELIIHVDMAAFEKHSVIGQRYKTIVLCGSVHVTQRAVAHESA